MPLYKRLLIFHISEKANLCYQIIYINKNAPENADLTLKRQIKNLNIALTISTFQFFFNDIDSLQKLFQMHPKICVLYQHFKINKLI